MKEKHIEFILDESILNDDSKLISKIDCLLRTANTAVLSETQNQFGERDLYEPLFDSHERQLIKNKILEKVKLL